MVAVVSYRDLSCSRPQMDAHLEWSWSTASQQPPQVISSAEAAAIPVEASARLYIPWSGFKPGFEPPPSSANKPFLLLRHVVCGYHR